VALCEITLTTCLPSTSSIVLHHIKISGLMHNALQLELFFMNRTAMVYILCFCYCVAVAFIVLHGCLYIYDTLLYGIQLL